ncbi:MAG: SCP2 sterol-binding domain-containing protein [Methylococcaceae bacterium]|jgi:ubiquinone biosynthesis protein UbiJ
MVVKLIVVNALEAVLQQYLALDENSSAFLQPMAGKVIAVTLEPFNETLYLCPNSQTIQILPDFQGQTDTQLTGSLWAFGLMGLNKNPMQSIFSGEVKITGDMSTGRKFQELFAKLDINLEEKLSHYTGDVVAHQLGQFFRGGKSWGTDTLSTFIANTKEFLQEETRQLPATAEIDIFYRHIDELRIEFDRLQKKVERLDQNLGTHTNEPEINLK